MHVSIPKTQLISWNMSHRKTE